MKSRFWIIAFACALAGELVAIYYNQSLLQTIFKPLLVPMLIGYFLTLTWNSGSSLRKWIVLALLFSWFGDVTLMFQEKNEIYFLIGLSLFLLAHIFYIIYFHLVRIREGIRGNPWFLVIVVIYYAALITWLSPYLGDKKLPVRIYGIAISFMFMLAMHMLFIKNRSGGKWMMTGALLFIISDTVLAINKFYHSFEESGLLIMGTYGLAQLFITEGAVQYDGKAKSN